MHESIIRTEGKTPQKAEGAANGRLISDWLFGWAEQGA
jgi:hypothetical protein